MALEKPKTFEIPPEKKTSRIKIYPFTFIRNVWTKRRKFSKHVRFDNPTKNIPIYYTTRGIYEDMLKDRTRKKLR